MKNVFSLAGAVVVSVLFGAGCSCGTPAGTDGGCVEPTDWCQSFGKNCGLIPGRCSDAVRCGTCTAPDTCGGNGVENVCGRPGGTGGGTAGSGGGSSGGGSAGGGSAGGGSTGGGSAGGGAGGGSVDGGADAGTCGGRVGCACSKDFECVGATATCVHGFCTRACGGGSGVTSCNDPAVSAPGALGSVYACWPLGAGLVNLCWPNGSGASCDAGPCPRATEACVSGVCQYLRTGSTTVPRTDLRCHRDGDCKGDEACAFFGSLDDDNVRAEGACVFRGMDAGERLAQGEPCSTDSMCASFACQGGTCSAMCVTGADCSAFRKCLVTPGPPVRFAEFSTEFAGWCTLWSGTGLNCTANSGCLTGQTCTPYLSLANNDTSVGVSGGCRALPNGTGAAVGAACTTNAQCASGDCAFNILSGRGYCTAACFGGAADCGGGTACRPRVIEALDPATGADDLSIGYCVRTGVGEACGITLACRPCVNDPDCNPAQGVTCDLTDHVCRDRFGRCADPCRHDCQPAGSGCPTGTTCVTAQGVSQTTPVCIDNTTGACVRADLTPQLRYDHGVCGDPGDGGAQSDLCYYFGRVDSGTAQRDVFACGAGCVSSATCTPIGLGDGGSLATTCRTTHEASGTAQTPNQCAPSSAF